MRKVADQIAMAEFLDLKTALSRRTRPRPVDGMVRQAQRRVGGHRTVHTTQHYVLHEIVDEYVAAAQSLCSTTA